MPAPTKLLLTTIPFCNIWPAAGEHHMALLSRVFTTRTLLQIIVVLSATFMMKALSAGYDFNWATALING
jgi:hypothetical protein